MKKNIFFLLLLTCCFKIYAQQNVGIGTASPNASSLLEISSSNKGLLIPRVLLASETDVTTIPSPPNALLIFNNNEALPDGRGFYFWNAISNKWVKLATNNNLNNIDYWSHNGNNGTDPAVNFIGTTDNNALVFKTNNILSGKIDPGPNNVFFGQSAGIGITSGTNNSFLGHQAGIINTSGSNNLFVGHLAGNLNSSGAENVFLGQDAGKANTIGNQNVFAGEDAGMSNTTGSQNVFAGNGAGRENTIGSENIAIGVDALLSNTTGESNIAIGNRTLANTIAGEGNIAIGYNSLDLNETGIFNTSIGYVAGPIVSNVSFTTCLGYNSQVTTSNTMAFGDRTVTKWAFGLSTTQHALQVGSTNTNGNGAFLTQGGTWTNASDINKKEDFTALNGTDLLQKIASLSITKWRYKGTSEYHIGPTAQEFYKLFNVGADDKGISTVDPAGIALAAIQEQQKIIEKQNEMILLLEKRIEALEKK